MEVLAKTSRKRKIEEVPEDDDEDSEVEENPEKEKLLASILDPNTWSDVTVIVGETGEKYCLQEAALSSKSDFFKTALKRGTFIEGQERIIRLPEIQPKAFENILLWVYGGEVFGTIYLKGKNTIVDTFEAADYLLLTPYKTSILDHVTQCVWNRLNNPYGLEKGIGPEMSPGDALDILLLSYEFCHFSEMDAVTRCIELLIVSVHTTTEELSKLDGWNETLATMWKKAQNGLIKSSNCRPCLHVIQNQKNCVSCGTPFGRAREFGLRHAEKVIETKGIEALEHDPPLP
ncbi:hypothetical protein TWF281_003732 [Arthrobotrys megalospora]